MRNLLIGLVLLPCAAIGDWRDSYRLASISDVIQTQWLKSNGWTEDNAQLRHTTDVETALIQAAYCEAQIWLVSRLPKRLRPIVGIVAVAVRLVPVWENARKGCPTTFVVPILAIQFRS